MDKAGQIFWSNGLLYKKRKQINKRKKKKDKKEGHIFGSNRRLQSKEMNNEDLMFISNAQTKEKINNRGS